MTSRPISVRVIELLPYIFFLGLVYSVFPTTTDDPYIIFRYARNILDGYGPVFNPGERVEGYSSPYYLLTTVGLSALLPSIDILLKAKVLGIIFGLRAIRQAGRTASMLGLGWTQCFLVKLLLSVNVNFAVSAVDGLGTVICSCLILATVMEYIDESRGDKRVRSAGYLFLATMIRPECLLVFFSALLLRAINAIRRRGTVVYELRWALTFLVPAVVVLMLRVAYYNDIFPNTYYAKHIELSSGIIPGWRFLSRIVWPSDCSWSQDAHPGSLIIWIALSTAIIFWTLSIIGMIRLTSRDAGLFIVLTILCFVLFILRFGGDWMPGSRFLCPVMPIMTVCFVYGIRAVRVFFRRWPVTHDYHIALCRFGTAGVVLLFCLFGIANPLSVWASGQLTTSGSAMLKHSGSLGRKWLVSANYIKRHFPQFATVAYSEVGYAGYINPKMKFIDTRGLTDHEIAMLPSRYKGSWGVDDENWGSSGDPLGEILERRQPDAIIDFVNSTGPKAIHENYVMTAIIFDKQDSLREIRPTAVYSRFNGDVELPGVVPSAH